MESILGKLPRDKRISCSLPFDQIHQQFDQIFAKSIPNWSISSISQMEIETVINRPMNTLKISYVHD